MAQKRACGDLACDSARVLPLPKDTRSKLCEASTAWVLSDGASHGSDNLRAGCAHLEKALVAQTLLDRTGETQSHESLALFSF